MRDRLLRIASVGFSITILYHLPCSLAYADQTPRPFSIQEHLVSRLPTRQCYLPGSITAQSNRGPTLISSQEPRVESSVDHPGNLFSASDSLRDVDLHALFHRVRDHYGEIGHHLSAELTLSDAKTVNAFARDQKTVIVTRSLIARTKTASEIAFVMAHELAHIVLGHTEASGVTGELEADALALKVVMALGLDPCSGSSVLERLGTPAKLTLVSVSPRLTALHDKTFRFCG